MNTSDRIRFIARAAVAFAKITHERLSPTELESRKKSEAERLARATSVGVDTVTSYFGSAYDAECKRLDEVAAATIDQSAAALAGEVFGLVKSAGPNPDQGKASELSEHIKKRVDEAVSSPLLSGLSVRSDALRSAFEASLRRALDLILRAETNSDNSELAPVDSDAPAGRPDVAALRASINSAKEAHRAALAEASSISTRVAVLRAELQSLRAAGSTPEDVAAFETKVKQAETDLRDAQERESCALEDVNAALDAAAEAIG